MTSSRAGNNKFVTVLPTDEFHSLNLHLFIQLVAVIQHKSDK